MKRLLFSIFITVVIVFILLTQISLNDLYGLLRHIDPLWAVLGSACYLAGILTRAVRYRWVIHSKKIPFPELFRISAFYNLALMVLPSKLGELSYPYLLNRISGLNITEGLASLIVSRVYDFLIVLTIFLFASIGYQDLFRINLLLIILLGCVLIGLVLLVFFYLNDLFRLFSTLLERMPGWVGLRNRKFFQWSQSKVHELAQDFSAIKAKRAYLSIGLTSFISWVFVFWMFYAFLTGFGIRVPYLRVVFASTLGILANALPISGLGNWGLLEAGWAAGFILVGLSKDKAIATGFTVHIMIFAVGALIALICWMTMRSSVLPAVGGRRAQTKKPFPTSTSQEDQ